MIQSTFFNVSIDGAVATVTMSRADKANGMTPDFWTDLPRITRQLGEMGNIRAMIIAGEGKHYTGGMDLSSFNAIADLMKGEPGRAAYALRKEILRLQDAFNALEEVPFPVIAAIQGACIGAGVDMTAACDIRLASEDAFFAIEEIHIGMTADVGTLQRLPKLIAPGIVRELAYTGRRFSAVEARQWGFLNSLHPDQAETLKAAQDLATQIAKKSPLAVTGIKHSLNNSRDNSVSQGLEYIANWNAGMLRPEDMLSAVQAKMARKETEFKDLMESRKQDKA